MLLALQLRESVCCCGDLVRLGAVTKQMLYSMFMQQVASCVVIASVHGNMPSYAHKKAFSHAYAVPILPCIWMAVGRQYRATFCFLLGHILGDEHRLTLDGFHKLVQLVMNSRRLSYYCLCKRITCDCKPNGIMATSLPMQSAAELV